MLRFKCPAEAHVKLIVLWPQQRSQELRTGFNSCFLPPSTYSSLLFLLLPPLFCCPKPDARTTDPASVSATATTIGFGRRKEERRRDKEKKGREEIGLREEEGHCFGDVSEVILVVPRPL